MKQNNCTSWAHTIKLSVSGAVFLALFLAVVIACSGGGSGDLMAGGGIGGTGISVGEISGFGSVIVNDVDFDTETAQVVINNKQVGTGDITVREMLALGMVVRVEGRISGDDTGKADRIVFTENVNGPVTMIELLDSVVKKIVVLGQVVIVDDRTRYKNTDFDSLSVEDGLQISGWPDETGVVQATYVAKIITSDDRAAVKGLVAEVNALQKTFRINQLLVDFSEATLDGFPADLPEVSQLVFARGFLDADNILVAAQLSLVDDLGLDDADDIEIEGIVTQFSSPHEFILGTTAVQTDEVTSFNGIKADEIVTGVRLLVKGALSGGLLLANEVVSKDKVNIEGRVAEVDYGSMEIKLRGLSPLIIHVNKLTKIAGNARDLADIQAGQQIKVLGYIAGENKVEAARLKVDKKTSDKVKLQGPVTSIDLPTIHVFGVPVDTRLIPEEEINDDDDDDEVDDEVDDDNNQREDFLNDLAVGDIVNVRGKLTVNDVIWSEIELTDDD